MEILVREEGKWNEYIFRIDALDELCLGLFIIIDNCKVLNTVTTEVKEEELELTGR